MINIKEGSDYIICKLRKQFYKQDNDIYLVNVYARPYNTSCSTEQNSGKDIINKVEEVINNLREEGDVIVCGDFNARIARKSGSVVNDSDTFLPMPDDYIPDNNIPRQSQDIRTNSHGSHFLNLIINNQLTILNGRTLGDSSGKFTSIQKQGCSVVDYFAVSNSIKYRVNYVKVLDLTEHSDHKPLSLELECKPMNINPSEPLSAMYQPAPLRFIFNVENKDKFQQSQSNESSRSMLQSLNITIDNIVSSNGDALDQSKITSTVIDTNNKFTEHLRDIAANCFKQTKNNKKRQSNKPWLNWQTRLGKRELRKATTAASEHTTNSFIREKFYKVKGIYKKLLSKTSNKFFEQLNFFVLDDYTSFYQDINSAKLKGTGVALYIHNSLNASTVHDLCKTTDHFESHFITATLGSNKVTIGVTYNPPSGEDKQFLIEVTETLKKCPKHNLYLIGDFNFDLLTLASEDSKKFEELITSYGLFPLISKVTHTRPNCRGTCIDNILTTEPINVNLTGIIEQSLSHHSSVFAISKLSHSYAKKEAVALNYDFSESKTELFVKSLENLSVEGENSLGDNLDDFLNIFNTKIDEFFKLDQPKISKRNWLVNPWITEGLIISINKKRKSL